MSSRSELPTLPPGEVTLEDVYQMQLQQSEQIAALIRMVTRLANKVNALHEAQRPHRMAASLEE